MHIVVTLKQVIDPNTPSVRLRIGADGRSLELPAGMSPVVNGYDANAVEAAIALKEKHGGSITAISVGDASCKNALRRAIGMGVDTAVHIVGPEGLAADSMLIATLLGAALKKLPAADLILCGRQASDTDSGQVPLLLAAILGLPAVVPVKSIDLVEPGAVVVERMGDSLTQHLHVVLPALIGVSNEINKPRPVPLKGVMTAKKAEIPTWTPADLGLGGVAPGLRLRRLSIPDLPDRRAEFISGPNGAACGIALAERLRHEGLI